ncbi:MAG TPA: chemotaxis protein CheX [Candidatus Eisenbacteria bacterium]|nr:chemotaxis protein CheX [Candidatus Eisenbacteria bacterium]
MSTTTIDLQEWLDTLTEVAKHYGSTHLRFDRNTAPPEPAAPGAPRPAVYVSILGARSSMHLGIATTPDGARALARAFLGLRGPEELADRDVVDGLSEILNILAGKVKSKMSTRDASLKLGLPMFVSGSVGHGEGIEKATADVMMGPVPCQLQVFRQSRTA